MMYLFLILFFGGIIFLFIWLFKSSNKLNKRKQNLYEAFAHKMGLQHSIDTRAGIDYNKLEGSLDGYKIELFELKVRKSKHKRLATNITFIDVPISFNFRIDKKDVLNQPGDLLGMSTIKIGKKSLDQLFDFRTSSEDGFKAMMTSTVHVELKSIAKELDLSSTIYARNGTLTFAKSSGFQEEKHFRFAERIINLMLSLIRDKNL